MGRVRMDWRRFTKFLLVVIGVPLAAWWLISKLSQVTPESESRPQWNPVKHVVYESPAWKVNRLMQNRRDQVLAWAQGRVKPPPRSEERTRLPYGSPEWTGLLLTIFQTGEEDRIMWVVPGGLTRSGAAYRVSILNGKLEIFELGPQLQRREAPELFEQMGGRTGRGIPVGPDVSRTGMLWDVEKDPRYVWRPEQLAASTQEAEARGFRVFLSEVELGDNQPVRLGQTVVCRGRHEGLGMDAGRARRVALTLPLAGSKQVRTLVAEPKEVLRQMGRFEATFQIPAAAEGGAALRTGNVIWGVTLVEADPAKPISNAVLCRMRLEAAPAEESRE